MREQLSDIQTLIWGCPVRAPVFLLHLTIVSSTLSLAKRDIQILRQLNFVGRPLLPRTVGFLITYPCCLRY